MVRVCPCKGCVPPKRNATCHFECKEYIEWKKESDENNKRIREDKEREARMNGFRRDGLEKARRAHRSRG